MSERTPLKLRTSRRRGTPCADELAEDLTNYLLGRTDAPPTIRLTRPKEAS